MRMSAPWLAPINANPKKTSCIGKLVLHLTQAHTVFATQKSFLGRMDFLYCLLSNLHILWLKGLPLSSLWRQQELRRAA